MKDDMDGLFPIFWEIGVESLLRTRALISNVSILAISRSVRYVWSIFL